MPLLPLFSLLHLLIGATVGVGFLAYSEHLTETQMLELERAVVARRFFGYILRRMRKLSGLTPEGLADKFGVSIKTISRWELGESKIPVESFLAACIILGFDPGETLNKVAFILDEFTKDENFAKSLRSFDGSDIPEQVEQRLRSEAHKVIRL